MVSAKEVREYLALPSCGKEIVRKIQRCEFEIDGSIVVLVGSYFEDEKQEQFFMGKDIHEVEIYLSQRGFNVEVIKEGENVITTVRLKVSV